MNYHVGGRVGRLRSGGISGADSALATGRGPNMFWSKS